MNIIMSLKLLGGLLILGVGFGLLVYLIVKLSVKMAYKK